MTFNFLKTVAETSSRRVAMSMLGCVTGLLFYVAFDTMTGSDNTSVLIKPELTQAEYETLKAHCSQTETPVADTDPITQEDVQLETAILALCEQLDTGKGFTITDR